MRARSLPAHTHRFRTCFGVFWFVIYNYSCLATGFPNPLSALSVLISSLQRFISPTFLPLGVKCGIYFGNHSLPMFLHDHKRAAVCFCCRPAFELKLLLSLGPSHSQLCLFLKFLQFASLLPKFYLRNTQGLFPWRATIFLLPITHCRVISYDASYYYFGFPSFIVFWHFLSHSLFLCSLLIALVRLLSFCLSYFVS